VVDRGRRSPTGNTSRCVPRAIYNPSFLPFTSPVPFLLIRQAVTSDWKFFLDDDAWLKLWAQRHGGSGAEALAQELRRLPWRTQRE
jgi:hypothetical protein